MSSLLSLLLYLKLSETKIVNYYSNITRLVIFCFFKKFLFIYPVKYICCKGSWCVFLQKSVFGEQKTINQSRSINILCDLILVIVFILEVESSIGHFLLFLQNFVLSSNLFLYNFKISFCKTGVLSKLDKNKKNIF
jgi:hypothetical protein